MNGFLGFLICCIAAILSFSSGSILLGLIAAMFMFISFLTWGLNLRLTMGKDVKTLRRIRARMMLQNKTPEEINKALKEEISAVEAKTAPIPKWVRILYFVSVSGGIIILATVLVRYS